MRLGKADIKNLVFISVFLLRKDNQLEKSVRVLWAMI